MNSQLDQNTISPKLNSLSENESTEFLNYSLLETSRTNKVVNAADELIASLQNHRENQRARQVFEWEATRRETPQTLRGVA
ncbi:MAG: hypothetical protein ABI954_14800 [Pyrinomonadaceae bacterium]